MACGYPAIKLRVPKELHSRLATSAADLGVRLTGLIRMLFVEHLPEYEDRAAVIRRKERKEDS